MKFEQHRSPITTRNGLFVALAGLMLAGASIAAPPSTQLTVTGGVVSPATYDAASLSALASSTQTDTFLSGNASQTHTYQGTSLWGVVNASTVVNYGVNAHNDILNDYVVATGSDGYRVVYSMGELSPSFGNQSALVAYAELNSSTSQYQALTTDGFARTTAPGDIKGGRYVSNLVNLDVRSSGSTVAGTGGGTSNQFTVSGRVQHVMTFDQTALAALPGVTEVVGSDTYTGVSLWDLLNTTVGLVTDPNVKNDLLNMYVVATGSDGYKAVFSMGELSSSFGDQPDIIATSKNGQSLGSTGFARLVVPNDVKAGRYVSNLISLEVFSASPVPEPETCLLLITGLGLITWTRCRYG